MKVNIQHGNISGELVEMYDDDALYIGPPHDQRDLVGFTFGDQRFGLRTRLCVHEVSDTQVYFVLEDNKQP